MKIVNKKTKEYLIKCPPLIVHKMLDEYMLSSPIKEIIVAACIHGLDVYRSLDWLARKHQIHISRWQFSRKLGEGLEKFYNTHTFLGRDLQTFLQE